MSTTLSKWIGALGLATLMALSGSAQAAARGDYYQFSGAPGGAPERDALYNCITYRATRIDNNIDFNWGGGNPGIGGLGNDNFGVRWQGKIKFPTAGTWKLFIAGDDGVRLWVSPTPIDVADPGLPLIDDWSLHGEREAPPAGSDEGTVPNDDIADVVVASDNQEFFFLYEFYEQGGDARARLRWEGPGSPASPAKQIIPAANLIAADPPTGDKPVATAPTVNVTGPHSATVTYTAPAAAGEGCFDLRASNFPITADNFASASLINIPVDEKPVPGETATIEFNNLQALQEYYFAVRGTSNALITGDPATSTKVTTQPPSDPQTITAGQEGITGYYYTYIPRKNAPDRLLEAFAPVNFHFARVDPNIDFDWGTASPNLDDPTVPVDGFAVRWVGTFTVPADGTYYFNLRTDDGAALWISETAIDVLDPGTPLIWDWIDRGPTDSISTGVPLKAGTSYHLLAEMYENGGGAYAKLRYGTDPTTLTGPDATTAIPTENLKTGVPLPAGLFEGPARVNGRLVDAADANAGVCCAEAILQIGDGRASAGVNGEGYFTLPAKSAEGTLSVRSTLLNTQRDIPSTTITPAANQVSSPTLQATSTSLTESEHKLDMANSTWKLFMRYTGTSSAAKPAEVTLFNPQWILPGFDDSGWITQPDPDNIFTPKDAEGRDLWPKGGHFVLRGRFNLPDTLNVANGVQIRNASVDSRVYSAWVNGVPVSHSVGNSQGNILVPKGILKSGAGAENENVIVYFAANDGFNTGMINPPYVTPVSSATGHLYVHMTGANVPHLADFHDYPGDWYGVGNSITIGVYDDNGILVATAGTTQNGVAQFYSLQPGTYHLRTLGIPRTSDRWMQTLNIPIVAGEVARAELKTNPARGLNNSWLDERYNEGPWWAKPNVSQESAAVPPEEVEATDSTLPAHPDFQPTDADGWYKMVLMPHDPKSAPDHTGLRMPDPNDATRMVAAFGDNMWSVARVEFNLFEAFNQTQNGQPVDLFLDDFNNDDDDVVFLNGKEIGRQGCCGERNFRIPRSGEDAVPVKFTPVNPTPEQIAANKNDLVIYWRNGGGGSFLTDRNRSIRIRVAPMEAFFEPFKPFGVTATGGNNQAVITFSPSTGAASYDVFRSTLAEGPYTKVNTEPVTTPTFTDTTAQNGTEYFYYVTAVNTFGSSDESQVVTVTLAAPPPAPMGLAATAGNAQVALNWTASAGAASYNVYRSTTANVAVSAGNKINAQPVTTTTYTDTTAANGTQYFYVVTAVNETGEGDKSNEVSATPVAPITIPPAPTGVAAAVNNNQIVLNWTASSGAVSYNVYRSTTANVAINAGNKINTAEVTTTTFTDPNATPGTQYFYVVTAVNTAGESGASAEVNATVPAPICKGDVNGSKTVDVADAVATLQHAVALPGSPNRLTGDNLLAADVDNDGDVNVTDAVRMLQAIAGLEPGKSLIPSLTCP